MSYLQSMICMNNSLRGVGFDEYMQLCRQGSKLDSVQPNYSLERVMQTVKIFIGM